MLLGARVRGAVRGALVAIGQRVWPDTHRLGIGPVILPDAPRILMLQLQRVGDTLAASSALQAVRRRYPLGSIDIVGGPEAAGLYRRSDLVRRIHLMSRSGGVWARGLACARVVRTLRRERYDCVLACANHVSLRHAGLAWLTGARIRVGFDRAGAGFLFTRRLAVDLGRGCYDENLELAGAVGAATGIADRGPGVVEYDATDASAASALLAAHGVSERRPLLVLHPGANWQSKTWYPERWAAVADALAGDGYHVVFVGVDADRTVVSAVQREMRAPSASLCGETSLTQLAALLSRAALFVGTDSGPRHIAAAARCPQVTIMSSQDLPGRWRIPGAAETVLRSDPPCAACLRHICSHRHCMTVIEAERVVAVCRDARPVRANPRRERAIATTR
jgi:ADP-heptose:LPS heptosyltransferase